MNLKEIKARDEAASPVWFENPCGQLGQTYRDRRDLLKRLDEMDLTLAQYIRREQEMASEIARLKL